jgi:hypothetical protein
MRSIDRLEVSAVDPSLPTARAPTQPPKAATSAESAIPKLSAIGLTLNPITPNLSLARNAQPLCGAVLDGCYLLIGTTSGLDFLPLPEKGSLPVQHSGLKKRHETRKPLSLIKRTRFKQIVVLNERSNVLVAIAGRNDHVRGACVHSSAIRKPVLTPLSLQSIRSMEYARLSISAWPRWTRCTGIRFRPRRRRKASSETTFRRASPQI